MLAKLKNFNRYNRFVLIINFHNCFIKALTEIFQFHRALPYSAKYIFSEASSYLFFFISVTLAIVQVSISSTFYEQLLRAHIPKAEKKTDSLTAFFTLLGSANVLCSPF